MDGKKTNLTPELKEIYDRVMNTSTPPSAQPASSPPAAAANPPQGTIGLNTLGQQPAADAAPQVNPLNPPAPPISPVPPVGGPFSGATTPPPAADGPQLPTMPAIGAEAAPPTPSPAEQALTNTPARPLTDGNTFAFNGTVKTPTPAEGQPAAAVVGGAKKPKISMPILIALGVVFVAAWGVFWAVILGIIQR